MTSVEVVRDRECPACGAPPGRWCQNIYGLTRVHAARREGPS